MSGSMSDSVNNSANNSTDIPDSFISKLKAEFVKKYDRNGHIREAIPKHSSDMLAIPDKHLDLLHKFAQSNPIYYNSYEMDILDVPCVVYEGDINEYWISSIKHDVSNQPFYPTWILSAYEVACESKRYRATHLVDIGSGDGRIAYCGQILGLESYGIEIDPSLAQLQQEISQKTSVPCTVKNADANLFDYMSLNLDRVVFCIGGLPEMGEMLAKSIISKVLTYNLDEPMFVFMGSFQLKKFSDHSKWGWGFVLDKMNLCVQNAIVLPTCWTMDQKKDTPYIFTKRC